MVGVGPDGSVGGQYGPREQTLPSSPSTGKRTPMDPCKRDPLLGMPARRNLAPPRRLRGGEYPFPAPL